MVSFRLVAAILVLPFAAAPVAAEGLGGWSKSQRLDVKFAPPSPSPSVFSDLPEAPPGGAQSLPGKQPQPRMSLKPNAPPSSSASGGWYQTKPTITLRGSDPSAAPGVKPKFNMFKPDGTPLR